MKTIISITAPTCSGKNFLFNELKKHGFLKLVSTTTRAPRDGEIDGEDYFFISHEESLQMEAEGKFAELIEFNSIRYGITEEELKKKTESELPVIVILTPSGVGIYKKLCTERGIKLIKIFIDTPENVRIERLKQRTLNDILSECKDPLSKTDGVSFSLIDKVVSKQFSIFTSRLKTMINDEKYWVDDWEYDMIVPGDNIDVALSLIIKYEF